jgi:hypothetical protein
MLVCTRSFTVDGERFEAGPGPVTRVCEDHPILATHGDCFEDDPDQIGTMRWRERQLRKAARSGPRYDPATETRIREDRVAELEAMNGPPAPREQTFWRSTERLLERLADPDGRRAREHREHEANIALIDAALAAPIERDLDEIGAWVLEERERRRRWS